MNWYTCVACKSCLPLSGDAAKVEERINPGLALQPLPLATNPSPHTEAHLKSAHPCAGAHISKRHEASSAQLSPPKTSGKCVPREAWLTSWALRKQKNTSKSKNSIFFCLFALAPIIFEIGKLEKSQKRHQSLYFVLQFLKVKAEDSRTILNIEENSVCIDTYTHTCYLSLALENLTLTIILQFIKQLCVIF